MENNNQETSILKKVSELRDKLVSLNQKMEEITEELKEKNTQ